MSEQYHVYYVFDDPWSTEDLAALISFVDRTSRVEAPVETSTEAVRSAEEIGEPSHYVDELVDGVGRLDVWVTAAIQCSLRVDVDPSGSSTVLDRPDLCLTVSDYQFTSTLDGESESEAIDRIDAFYDFLIGLYEQFVESDRPPVYVYGLTFDDAFRIENPDSTVSVSDERLRNGEMPGVYWCQIVPPGIVAALGEETLLSTPGYRTDRVADGAVLLVLHAFPHDRTEQRDAADHLGVPYELPSYKQR